MYVIISACKSGTIIDDIDDEQNRIVYTSCNSTENGKVFPDLASSLFPNGTIKALDPDYNASDADDNSDGKVSLYEIFDFAYDHVQYWVEYYEFESQTPQRWVGTSVNDSTSYIDGGVYN
jgi:hypothetical protein